MLLLLSVIMKHNNRLFCFFGRCLSYCLGKLTINVYDISFTWRCK
jgi:hypothetical protein